MSKGVGVPAEKFDSKTCFLQNKIECQVGRGAVSPVSFFSLWDPSGTVFLVLYLELESRSRFSAGSAGQRGRASGGEAARGSLGRCAVAGIHWAALAQSVCR